MNSAVEVSNLPVNNHTEYLTLSKRVCVCYLIQICCKCTQYKTHFNYVLTSAVVLAAVTWSSHIRRLTLREMRKTVLDDFQHIIILTGWLNTLRCHMRLFLTKRIVKEALITSVVLWCWQIHRRSELSCRHGKIPMRLGPSHAVW